MVGDELGLFVEGEKLGASLGLEVGELLGRLLLGESLGRLLIGDNDGRLLVGDLLGRPDEGALDG